MDDPEERLDRAFQALSDSTRRWIWDQLGHEPGLTTAQLAARRKRMTRWSVMKHLAALREAGLIETLPDGRRRRHYRAERGLDGVRNWVLNAGVEAR
jgi:DNA-binding transcriptional ArsR family regulator